MERISTFFSKFSSVLRKKQILIPIIVSLILGTLYGGSYWIIQSSIDSQLESKMELPMQGANPIILKNISLLSMSPDYLDFNFIFSLNESSSGSLPSVEVKLHYFLLFYEADQISSLTFPYSPGDVINLKSSNFSIKVRVDISNQTRINNIFNRMIQKENVSLHVKGKFKVLGIGVIYPLFSIDQNIILPPLEEGDELLDFKFRNIQIVEKEMKLNIDYRLKVKNPLNFSFSLLGVQGNLYFDDPDGVGILNPRNNIFLMSFDYNWTDNPFVLHSNAANSKDLMLNIDIPDLFTTSRLVDEITNDQLKFNIKGGVLIIQLQDAVVEWEFNLEKIPISTT
ncbi:MAG: hypothetical protein DRO88_00535 [Promethearchaeia archaeon]|nr:MAG: hypothetical protein DRO88_00535 [Candidatus Lokiarchaeia archaeon]